MKLSVKIIMGLVGAGALAATGLVTGVIPNPFVELHENVASHRLHEMKVSWNHDGKFQSIPMLEQGTPFDDAKYFEMQPAISENPIEPEGVFTFDYEIEQYLRSGARSGNFRYKVNSNDNSMYINGVDIVNNPLFQPLRNNPYLRKYDLEFIIRNAQNDWFAFLNHAEQGKICVKLPSGFSFSNVIADVYTKNLEVLNSAKNNPVRVANDSPFEPYKGTFTADDGRQKGITFWFGKEEAQIATGVPIMGFGVGIFKDVLEKKQKFLAITESDDGVLKLLRLEKIDPWGINTKNYKVITLDYHLPAGMERAENIVNWLKIQQEEIARLRMQRKNCPPHQAGRECRQNFERQIKSIQEEIEQKAKNLGETLGLPVN